MSAVSNQSTLSVLITNKNKERIFMMCIRLTWSRYIFGDNQLAWSFGHTVDHCRRSWVFTHSQQFHKQLLYFHKEQ